MKSRGKLHILGAVVLFGAGLLASGCKSATPLSQADALKMIQTKYDQSAPSTTDIVVNDLGMREGVTDKYWAGIKKYPNGYWADFKLTPDGAKLIKLAGGGDVIEWRPDGPAAPNYSITITTVAVNHLKARDIHDMEDVGDTKTAVYTEDVDLSGLPDPLHTIAQNPGNQLSTEHTATFTLNGGAWALQSIQ